MPNMTGSEYAAGITIKRAHVTGYYHNSSDAFLQCVPCTDPKACGDILTNTLGRRLQDDDVVVESLYSKEYVKVLLSITGFTMFGVLVLFIILLRLRKDKIFKASSPGLLATALFGSMLLYLEVILSGLPKTTSICMLQPCARHLGFTLTYGSIILKTWRVSVILRVFKSRRLWTKDSELYQKLLLMLMAWVIYLAIWAIFDRVGVARIRWTKATYSGHNGWSWQFEDGQTANSESSSREIQNYLCDTQAWHFIGHAGEILCLLWGGYLCFYARKAPDLYNESTSISLALWNEVIWTVFMIISRCILLYHPDEAMSFIFLFTRTQLSVTTLLLLLFAPKIYMVFCKVREIHGVLTDVYGARRVHRLSLIMSKRGDVKAIRCVPCGPLAYLDQSEDSEAGSTDGASVRDVREDQYTRAEVDSLIELVSKLKGERELYKSQANRLLNVLNGLKRRQQEANPQQDHNRKDNDDDTSGFMTSDAQLQLGWGLNELDIDIAGDAAEENCLLRAINRGKRTSRASTTFTYVSASTPEESNGSSVFGVPEPFHLPNTNNHVVSRSLNSTRTTSLSPTFVSFWNSRRTASFSNSCSGNCEARLSQSKSLNTFEPRHPRTNCDRQRYSDTFIGGNNNDEGVNVYAFNVLRRKFANNHKSDTFDQLTLSDSGEFPRLFTTSDESLCLGENVHCLALQNVTSAFSEVDEESPPASESSPPTTTPPNEVQMSEDVQRQDNLSPTKQSNVPKSKTTNSREKLNFIMYI